MRGPGRIAEVSAGSPAPVETKTGATPPEFLPLKTPEPSNTGGSSTPKPEATISAIPLPDYERLLQRNLLMPVPGVDIKDVQNTFAELRGGTRPHEATDILAPRGTPVLAVDSGAVKKLFNSVRGGLSVYQFDAEGNYCYYYAHLDRYAEDLKEGMFLNRGDRIGYVGTTGNAPKNTPHLHFAIFKLGPEKLWWEGTPLNPYPIFVALSENPKK
jgi:murein DD-endopeptidase MepM/ murein hydrolase activator NlpD